MILISEYYYIYTFVDVPATSGQWLLPNKLSIQLDSRDTFPIFYALFLQLQLQASSLAVTLHIMRGLIFELKVVRFQDKPDDFTALVQEGIDIASIYNRFFL